ncbi:MAG: dimethyl sulfoxide reductase subunit A [Chloroflexi bacterium]|nr:dimethyl sulfoxide reductase subunit A [Chloroflexota bacterium]
MTSGKRSKADNKVKTVLTSCTVDCGGRCALKIHVKGGMIVGVENADAASEALHLRGCARGFAYRQRVHAPDRLKYPMKRVGARGEGKFERISWDEALDTVAEQLKRVKATYGPSAILYMGVAGGIGALYGPPVAERLLNLFGGCTRHWGVISCEGPIFAAQATYGGFITGNTPDDFVNSRLIVLWGWNPVESFRANAPFLKQAKEAGARIVCVDPRYTGSVAFLADQWIPIRPSTDAAMLIAMAYVIIKEGLQDQAFIDAYTVGFDQYKDYVLGREDGVAKTPAWAEAITGVPAAVISDLARDYATMKPAALVAGWGPGRTVYGEQYHRASAVLAAITGNVGIHGGYPGIVGSIGYMPAQPKFPAPPGQYIFPLGDNPAANKLAASPFYSWFYSDSGVHICKVADAMLRGKTGGYHTDLKLAYITNANPVNQWPDSNKMARALRKMEFIVVHELFMTPTAKLADILLPVNTALERNDIATSWMLSPPVYTYVNKAIDSAYECKSDLEICEELAARLGVTGYNDKTEDEWLREAAGAIEVIGDYDDLRRKAVLQLELSEYASFKEQIDDPKNNPFPTASGKIEIYSQTLADYNNPRLPPVPKYFEGWEKPLIEKYPLRIISAHSPTHAKSQFHNIPWLRELEPQRLWINPADARARGISDGDLVRIFNEQGQMLIPARVTERIMLGVTYLPDGAWFAPDESGVDRGGCQNVFTSDKPSPGAAFVCNSALVQVEKA